MRNCVMFVQNEYRILSVYCLSAISKTVDKTTKTTILRKSGPRDINVMVTVQTKLTRWSLELSLLLSKGDPWGRSLNWVDRGTRQTVPCQWNGDGKCVVAQGWWLSRWDDDCCWIWWKELVVTLLLSLYTFQSFECSTCSVCVVCHCFRIFDMMAFEGFGGSVCDLSFAKTAGIISLCV